MNISSRQLLTVAVSLFALSAAQAADSSNAQARFRQDMAVCNSGASYQDAATCRIEAKNALAEARRGGFRSSPNDGSDQYLRNAMQRCNALKGDDRVDCESRVRGEGKSSGSVGGGGIVRETVTVIEVK
jgi:uncharacterized protein YfaQ (DUF2300 family)